ASVGERASTTLGMAIANGGTRFRSYAQVDTDCGLERLDGVLAAREAHNSRAEVSIIAFPQAGILLEKGTAELLEQALTAGADMIGGLDPCGLDRDPVRQLDVVFGLAEKYQVPVDIHLHERGSLGAFSIELIAARTAALGMRGKVTISHAFALGSSNDDATVGQLVELLAAHDISVATVAPAGTGVLPIRRLTEAGVRVGLGQDGMRDYWSPYGNADLLDRSWQLAFTQGFRPDELIEYCVALATVGGRSVLDAEAPRVTSIADRPGLAVGDPADLVLVPGDSVTAAVMDRGDDRTVLRAGTVVADGRSLVGRRYRTAAR
ncbi:MAG: amidohydrolase family protein, partial [Nakamurella sp.]